MEITERDRLIYNLEICFNYLLTVLGTHLAILLIFEIQCSFNSSVVHIHIVMASNH